MSFGVRLGPFRVSTRSVDVRVGPFYASTRTRRRRSSSRNTSRTPQTYQPRGPVQYYEQAPPQHLSKFSDAQIFGIAVAVVLQLILVLVVLDALGII